MTSFHPDKICDQISDGILDECLKQDPYSRVAVETMGGHGKIFLTGEITTKATVNYKQVAKDIYKELLNKDIEVFSNIVSQSPEISKGVDIGGAGDQGIMVGYACQENKLKIPQEMYLARELLKPFKTDGKSQVTLENNIPTEMVLSVQGKKREELEDYVYKYLAESNYKSENEIKPFGLYCNNTGSFETGGFDADSGVTGRKIVVDAYGPRIPVGGGAFSGKDATKVDRSGAYMARFMALDALKKLGAEEVMVQLGYVIGRAEPIMVKFLVNKKIESINFDYDCQPDAIIERFDLRKPIYRDLAMNGHFGRPELPWEHLIA